MSLPQPSCPKSPDTAPQMTGAGVATTKLRLLQRKSCLLMMRPPPRDDDPPSKQKEGAGSATRSTDAFTMPVMSCVVTETAWFEKLAPRCTGLLQASRIVVEVFVRFQPLPLVLIGARPLSLS